jgi:hypothetical protein
MKETFIYAGARATISAGSGGNGRLFWAYKILPVEPNAKDAFGCEFTIVHGDQVDDKFPKIGAILRVVDALEYARSAAKLAIDRAYDARMRLEVGCRRPGEADRMVGKATLYKELATLAKPGSPLRHRAAAPSGR